MLGPLIWLAYSEHVTEGGGGGGEGGGGAVGRAVDNHLFTVV